MTTLSATEAFMNLDHQGARWYRKGIDVMDGNGSYAIQRLNQPVFVPYIPETDFRIAEQDRLFAIGSCFARGIELSMMSDGFHVESYADEFDSFELASPDVTGRGFTNRYTTFSIANEIEWAISPGGRYPTESLFEQADGTVIDPHVNPTLLWVDHERTAQRRATIETVYQRIAGCRIVVLTLGLVEAWYDHVADCYLNMTPSPAMVSAAPDRYEFRVTGFEENRAALGRIGDLLDASGHPDVQIVVTVSPVPLNATFSPRDVVAANAYSKGTLRSAAESWSMGKSNVHYFPSYEIVTNSGRGVAWAEDGRHVQGPLVQHIMRTFRENYCD